MEESRLQLLKRIQYLERSATLTKEIKYSSSEIVIQKLKSLVEKGDIKSFLGVDATFHYLLEKIESDVENLDQHAEEIRNFVNWSN